MQSDSPIPGNPLLTFVKVVWKYRLNPSMWPTISRLSFRYIRGRLMPAARLRRIAERTRYLKEEETNSLKWCVERAVTNEELVHQLPFPFVLTDVEEEFSDTFWQSRERVQSCPVKFGGAGNLDLLYSVAQSIGASSIVETGVAYGWSSLALLLSVRDRDGARVYSVDLPYLRTMFGDTDDWVGIAVPDSLRSRWRVFKMADREGLPRALRKAGLVDLAHYDSDKTPEGRAFGYGIIWKRLRKGGILISDDINDNLEFKRFSEKVGRTPIVVEWYEQGHHVKHQGILIK